MKRIAILITVFALAACVPIQPDDPQAPEPRAKGGLEELASVFAKMDQHDDASEYLARLLDFEACFLSFGTGLENSGNEFEKEFSDEEMVVLVMYSLSTFMSGIMYPEDYKQKVELEVKRQMYHLLTLSVDFCRELD